MRRILVLGLMVGATLISVVAVADARTPMTATVAADPQIRGQYGPQRDRRYRQRQTRPRVHSYTTTRIVFIGRQRYRETIRVTHLPNGRTRIQVINRVRIGHR